MTVMGPEDHPPSAHPAQKECKPDGRPVPGRNAYLRKHQLAPPQVEDPPSHRLGLSVVVPCHNEPDLLVTLGDLWSCDRPSCDVEVLVVINGSEVDPEPVRKRNRATRNETLAWTRRHRDLRLVFHVLYFPDLARRHAGVGVARKLGMDEAIARFDLAGNPDGIIAGLDADCRCRPDYLTSLCEHFESHPRSPGCAVYFEHPLGGLPDPRLRLAIARYELYLRYYIHGLRYAGYPHAYHTIGSCMAVRSRVYQKQGGMNRRQAGEDFYFLHKIIPLGGFTELTNTTVAPAARLSHRVPFGTGKALAACLEGRHKDYLVCAPQVFSDLNTLFACLPHLYQGVAYPEVLAPTILSFLHKNDFAARLAEIRANTASPPTFTGRFWHWFNALRILKFVHHATTEAHGQVPVETAARTMLRLRNMPGADLAGVSPTEALLGQYRKLDREGRY